MVERKSQGQTEVLGEKTRCNATFSTETHTEKKWHRIRAYERLATNCPVQQRIVLGNEDDARKQTV